MLAPIFRIASSIRLVAGVRIATVGCAPEQMRRAPVDLA